MDSGGFDYTSDCIGSQAFSDWCTGQAYSMLGGESTVPDTFSGVYDPDTGSWSNGASK